MGKIRIKLLGDEKTETKQKEKVRVRREQKKLREGLEVKAKPAVVKTVEKKKEKVKPVKEVKIKPAAPEKKASPKSETKKSAAKPKHSQRYVSALALVDRKKVYPLKEALELVIKTASTKFIASVDAHFNLNKKINLKKTENLKLEKKAPLAHGKIGKTNQKIEELQKSLEKMIKTVGHSNIIKLTISSSMGPGIKVKVG